MTLAVALDEARRLLETSNVPAPRLTAEVLLSHILRREKAFLFGHPEYELSTLENDAYRVALAERLSGRPTQYITGVQEFYGRDFRVTPDVMIPRPETEHIIEAALGLGGSFRRVVDVGCGSGAIAVTLSLELGCEAWATDVSRPAIRVAMDNARRLGGNVHFIACDLVSALASESFDLVASNPPYVPQTDAGGLQREVRDHEPHLALFGGISGLDFYRRLAAESPRVIRPGGWLVMEMGIRQLKPIHDMLRARWWGEIRVLNDLAGLPRTLAVRYMP